MKDIVARMTLVFLFSGVVFSFSLDSVFAEELPKGIKWLTNDKDPVISSDKAKKGGTFSTFITTFPLTIRVIGPDSNNSFAGYTRSLSMSLVGMHGNTRNLIPELATHWAYGKDGRSMFFKLNPKARWSDGKPVTADDYVFKLEMMRSKNIVAPWYNDYYTKEIEKVVKYDDHTIGVFAPQPKPDLWQFLNINPEPKHFYKGTIPEDFVKRYNWTIVPNTGPYQLTKFRKGKNFIFERKKNWWGKDLKYFKNRFNVDRVYVRVVRDENVAFELFKKGTLDTFNALSTEHWHLKCKGPLFDKGYIQKTGMYTDAPRSNRGFYLNTADPLFKEVKMRHAFAHAMNIDEGIKKVFRNDVVKLERLYTGYGEYENKSIQARDYNIKKVESIMKSLGWSRGGDGIWTKGKDRFSVKVTHGYAIYNDYLAFLKEEAKKAGVEIIIDYLDGATSFKKIQEKKHQASFSAWGVSLSPSPWQAFHSENANKPQTNNISNTADKTLDDYIDKYRNSVEKKERISLAKKIAQRVHDLGDFVPSHYFAHVRACHWRWVRFPEMPTTKLATQELVDPLSGGQFWIDRNTKRETKEAKSDDKTFPPSTKMLGEKPN